MPARHAEEASQSPPGDSILGELLPEIRTPPPGPASVRLARRLAESESRNVTFLTDDMPVFWSEARGANVRDADANVYVDLTSAFGVALAGHGHPKIVEAIRDQAGRLVHGMGDVHPPELKVRLLERLVELSPWAEARGVLASAGSEAVEIALKTAQLATGRDGVVAFEGAYHGLTLGALSVTENEAFRAPFHERLPDAVRFVPFPDRRTGGEPSADRCLSALRDALDATDSDGRSPGAVILEPIQGRAGVRIPPEGFLRSVADQTRRAGAVLILDEVLTGLGRTGSLFACQHEGVVPDLICLGKGLGGGLPLSCCLGSAQVMDAWPASTGEAIHTSTFLGHPLACAASLALLDLLEEAELVSRAQVEGERFRSHLADSLAGAQRVREVRGRGFLIGVELRSWGSEQDTGSSSVGGSTARAVGSAARAAAALVGDGLLLLPSGARGQVLEMLPPLTISPAQMDWSIQTLVKRLC